MEGVGSKGWWIKKIKTEVVQKRTSAPILVSMGNRLVELKESMLVIPSELSLPSFTYKVKSISKNFVKLLSPDSVVVNIPSSYFQTNLTVAVYE